MNIYWEVYGCEMNKSQAHSLMKFLKDNGYNNTKQIDNADIVIMYTCSVRKSAEDRALGRLGYFKHLKMTKNSDLKVFMLGCMAEIEEYDLVKNNLVDVLIGTTTQENILEVIKKTVNNEFKGRYGKHALDSNEVNFLPSAIDTEYNFRSYVSIIHGCSNYCSYCIVPYLRGSEFSRPSKEIIDDIKNLVIHGIKEIVLLGQNVNAYGKDNNEIPFYELLEKIANIKGVELISFMSPHPKDFDDELIDVIVKYNNISNSIHLPLQSGSDKILSKMGRKYNREKYLSIVNKFKEKSSEINFTTDIIVGFSDEEHDDYLKTLEVVKKVKYIDAFMYKYSPRPLVKNAPKDNIDNNLKSKRLSNLIEVQQKISIDLRKDMIGKSKKAIILKKSKKDDKMMLFKTFDGCNGVVEINEKPGSILNIVLTDLKGKTFIARREDD